MKKAHYAVLISALIISTLVMPRLYKGHSTMQKNEIEVVSGSMAEEEPTPCENDICHAPEPIAQYAQHIEKEAISLSEEEIKIQIGSELGRLSQVEKALDAEYNRATQNIDELDVDTLGEELRAIREIKLVYELMWRMVNAFELPMIEKANKDLKIFPHQIVDIRNGEIRLPPPTEELWDLCEKLFFKSMNKSAFTDEDIATIHRLASEIREMAKTNAPTSVFQMPKGE